MKNAIILMAASLGMLAACSGFNDIDLNNKTVPDETTLVERVIFEAPIIRSLGDDDETRASLSQEGEGSILFAWEATDTVGIYPDQGAQVFFAMENGVGTNVASFDGGGWALRQGSTYSCYYPFVGNMYLKRDTIPVSFENQEQTGVSNYEGVRFFLASEGTSSSAGALRFNFQMLNTVIRIKAIGLPAGTYTKLSLTTDEPLFVKEGTFGLGDMSITGKTYSNTMEINLKDFTLTEASTEANPVLIYLTSAPVDLRGHTVIIRAFSENGNIYKCEKSPGKAYEAQAWGGLKCEMKKAADIISFADPAVKRICIENWDIDGDGELDKDEAAAVTDIGLVFVMNTELESFDELQFFTSLTEIGDYCFSGCSNLSSITLPESITSIGKNAFYNCNLSSFNIPDGVALNEHSFSVIINTLVIPGCIINGSYVFSGSISSISFTGPILDQSSTMGILYDNCDCSRRPTSLFFGKDFSYMGEGSYHSLGLAIGGINTAGDETIDTIVVTSENPEYDSRGDCNAVIETNTNTLLLGCKNTIIPEDVTTIGDWAFCDGPTTITIPEQVSHICGSAFMRCWGLNSLIILATTPPSITDYLSFHSTPIIYVPSGSIEAYKTAEGWSAYADRIQGAQGGIVDPISGEEE